MHEMVDMKFYRDVNGYPRAEVDVPCEVLGHFFSVDVQGDAQWCGELLGIIEHVRNEVIPLWKGTGNAHTLILDKGKARIESEFADPPLECEIPLVEFEDALRKWCRLIKENPPGQSTR